jgi:ATP-binding cassette subfamily B multidrug efflux pump
MMMAGGPPEKLEDFKGSTKRLLRLLKPQRAIVAGALAFGAVGVFLSVLGPYLLGHATDVIFEGVIGKMLGQDLPPGVTREQAIEQLRAAGQNAQADLLSGVDAIPGQGIDFDRLAEVLMWVAIIYVFAWVFGVLQGRLTTRAVQAAVYDLRQQVEDKLARLPLSYFDKQPRGEVLSRATNDTDNIAQTLQQTFAQLVTALLTIVGVLGMMVWI